MLPYQWGTLGLDTILPSARITNAAESECVASLLWLSREGYFGQPDA